MRIEADMRAVEDRLTETEGDLREVEAKFTKLETLVFGIVDAASKTFGSTDEQFDAVKRQLAAIDHANESTFGVADETFEDVDRRLTALEAAKPQTVVTNECDVCGQVVDLEEEIDALEAQVDKLSVEVVTKNNTIRELQDALAETRKQATDKTNEVASLRQSKTLEPLPTWTSANGRTQRLRDMATPHLENVLGILYQRRLSPDFSDHGSGLFVAIRYELSRRAEVQRAERQVA